MFNISWLDYNFLIFTLIVWFFLVWNWCVNFFKVFFLKNFNFIIFLLIKVFFFLNLNLKIFLITFPIYVYLIFFLFLLIHVFLKLFIFFYFSNLLFSFKQKIVLQKYSMFFTFQEFTFYHVIRLPVFVFWGFKFWYRRKVKKKVVLVENYGNVSSIKYNMIDYPIWWFQFLDERIKKAFVWFDSLNFEPILGWLNYSIPSFHIDLNRSKNPKPPIFTYMLYEPLWLISFYWFFFKTEFYFTKLFNFLFCFWISKIFDNFFLFCKLISEFPITIYFLYLYYFFCKFFSINKLLFNNTTIFVINVIKKLIIRWRLNEIFLDTLNFYYIFLFSFYLFKGIILIFLSLIWIFWFYFYLFLSYVFESINPNAFLQSRKFTFNNYLIRVEDFYYLKISYLKRLFFWFFWFS